MNKHCKKIRSCLFGCAAIVAGFARVNATTIVTPPDSAPAVRAAAQEMAAILGRVYPDDTFVLGQKPPEGENYIHLGAADADPHQRFSATNRLAGSESFVVLSTNDGPRRILSITGLDARGTAHGAAALLKAMGCGLYISGDALPPQRKGPFDVGNWDFADRPLVKERIVFNWHNFLSGCSTWNPDDWRKWIRAAHLGGFNAIMVHAYGNNPMAAFSFRGKEKPVGFLSTTVKGRDWSTPHVNDVRRLWGGAVFDRPVFGPDAGMVPDDQRVAAARALMREAFASAQERGLDVYFAVDIDTPTSNPPELVGLLPENARFKVRVPTKGKPDLDVWLPDPDTPEGYSYWKAQVDALMEQYPQITCLVPWFRAGGTPWTELKREELPPSWQKEYDSEIARTPGAAEFKWSHNLFAMAKVVRAFRKALDMGGHQSVRLATGSWRFDCVPAADRFMPPGVLLLPLDYEVLHGKSQLRDAASRSVIRDAAARRPMVPIVWAHHDDGDYLGRPYMPFDAFHSRLEDARASGFGIIHWTTRPLDIYFESLSRQTWSATRDEGLDATCSNMAERLFGRESSAAGTRYLSRWITGAPRFGRETSDWVIDRRLGRADELARACDERIEVLGSLNPSDDGQRAHVTYFKNLERFMAAFHQTHDIYQRSRDEWAKGNVAGAKDLMSHCHPESVIETYAACCRAGGITRGEQGVIVGLNLRWLTHIIGHRQAIGMDPVRINFAPTQHDPLAQAAGKFTFHFDDDHRVWQCLGEDETGATTFRLPADKISAASAKTPVPVEICTTGIDITGPITLTLQPMMALGKKELGPAPKLLPAQYNLTLSFLRPDSGAPTTAKIAINKDPATAVTLEPSKGASLLVDQRTLTLTIGPDGQARLAITPVTGTPRLCAAVLEPR